MITVLAMLIGLSQSQPVTPQYPSELDQQSITFMDEYFQHLSSRDVMDQFQHDYAKYIKYFNKVKRKEEVLREKAAFVRRWPERNYRPRQNTIRVTCEMLYGEPVCAVNGLVDFKCRSPQRHAVSTGTAYFFAYLWFDKDRPEIIGEDSGLVR
jgi:hypothetical protein